MDPDAIIKKATEFHSRGDLKKARELYQEVLEIDEKNLHAHVLLGSIFYYFNDVVDAERHYRRALELNPNYAMPYFNVGVIKQDKGELDEAIELYKTAIEKNPEYPQAYYNLGAIYKDKGDLFEAFKNFKMALDLDENAEISKEEMEKIFEKIQGDVTRRESIKEAEQLLLEGGAIEEGGDVGRAVDYYKRASELNPGSIIALYLLGLAYEKLGDMRLAYETYNRALGIDPEVALREASFESIKLLQHLSGVPALGVEDFSKTAEAFRDRLKKNPKERISFKSFIMDARPKGMEQFLMRGMQVESRGDVDGAIREYKRAIEANPQVVMPYYLMGLALESTGDVDGAIETYKKAGDVGSDLSAQDSWVLSALLSNKLGGIMMDASECFEIFSDYRKSAGKKDAGTLVGFVKKRISKKSIEQLKEGYLLDFGGDEGLALEKFREAAKVDPHNALAYIIHGLAQENMSKPEEAMKQYTKMDKLDFELAARDVSGEVIDIVNEYMDRTTSDGHRVGDVLTKYVELVAKNPDKMLELLGYIEDIKLDSISSIIRGRMKEEEMVLGSGVRILRDAEDFRIDKDAKKEVKKQVGVGAGLVALDWKYKTARTIRSIAYDPKGRSMLAGSETGVLYHLDGKGGLLKKIQLDAAVVDLDISGDASKAVAALKNGVVTQVDLETGDVLWEVDMSEARPRSVAISQNGTDVAVGLQDSNVAKISRGQVKWTRATKGLTSMVDISGDGLTVFVASDGGDFSVIKNGGGSDTMEDSVPFHKPLRRVAVSPNGKYVAIGTDDGEVYLLDHNKNIIWKRELGHVANGLRVTGDGKYVLAGSSNGKALLHDHEGTLLWEYSTEDNIWDADISEDGKTIVLGCGLIFGSVYRLKSVI